VAIASQASPAVASKILLVEPTQTFAPHTEQPVMSTGCECVRAHTFEQAVTRLGSFRPLMILVDAAVLKQDRADGCSLLRAQEPNGDVPIVLIMSPDTPAEHIEASWRAGVDDCVMRPLRLVHLQSRVAALRTRPVPRRFLGKDRATQSVLIVDPDVVFRERLGKLLELNGLHLLYANDTRAAALTLKSLEEPVQLVVLRTESSKTEAVRVLEALRTELARPLDAMVIAAAGPEVVVPTDLTLYGWFDRAAEVPESLLHRIHPLFYRVLREIRAEERVPLFCAVEYREAGSQDPWASCFSYDMSPGGIFLKTLVPARPRSAIELKLHLPASREVLTGTGVVAWANAYSDRKVYSYPVGMGIQFLGMSPKGLGELREICRQFRSG
jgi:uncharacterized protein (TIGR02266 family)